MAESAPWDYQGTADRKREYLRSRRKLREIRDRLVAQTGTDAAFDYELLLLFSRTRISASLFGPFLALCVVGAMSIWASFETLAYWFAAVVVTKLALLRLCRAFERVEPDTAHVRSWQVRFIVFEALYAAAWGALVFIPLQGQVGVGFMVVTLALLLFTATQAMLASNIVTIATAATIPVTGGLIVFLVFFVEPQYQPITMVVALAQIYFMLLSRRIHDTNRAMLAFRAEKDALIAELEQEKSISDEARRRAETANVAKSRFLATMSHELRTPLNAILGFSEVMTDELFGPHAIDQYKDYSKDIYRSGKHLLELINEILDLSRIEAGRYELNEEAISLVDTVEDCIYLVKLRAQEKGVQIVEQYEPAMPKLWADERAARQICLNLLSNAVKFTPVGGTITVKCGWTMGGGQYVLISDTGPGIPEEELPIILNSFGQGTLAHQTAEDGAGLGLPIVRGLVKLHQGHFDLQSKLRHGTDVTVTFPRERVMKALPAMEETA
ncbi:MAG: HAMP domain-containing histidine kinase [Hyphomicrobiales bacterium]|nr:HAMP domain-containing histidine kinase [Hyphomicrobiales bacterium]